MPRPSDGGDAGCTARDAVTAATEGNHSYALAGLLLGIVAVIGLGVALLIPANPVPKE